MLMKKQLLFFVTLLCALTGLRAEEYTGESPYTWECGGSGYTNPFSKNNDTQALGNVRWTFSTSATSLYFGKEWTNATSAGRGLQFGKSKASVVPFKFTSSDFTGKTITKVTVTAAAAEANVMLEVKVGGVSLGSKSLGTAANGVELIFEGSAQGDIEICYNGGGNSSSNQKAAYLRAVKIEFTDGGGSENRVKVPTFSLASGTQVEKGTGVSIKTETEDASIYYTLNGDEPTVDSTPYEAPIIITSDVTVKAIAVKDGMDPSPVAVANYTVKPEYESLAAWLAAKPEGNARINAPLIVVYQNDKYLYVTEGGAFTMIYGTLNKTFANGDVIPAGVEGRFDADYNELIPVVASIGDATQGAAVAPEVVTAVSAGMVNRYVMLENVSVKSVDGNNVTADFNGAELTIFNRFGIEVTVADNMTVTGFVNIFKGELQIYPTEIVAGENAVVATPEVSPASGSEVFVGDVITVTCATSGARLFGYIGETTIECEAPFEYTVTASDLGKIIELSVYAEKEGFTASKEVEAIYEVVMPTVATPVVAPASSVIYPGDVVTVSCETEGALLYGYFGDIEIDQAAPFTYEVKESDLNATFELSVLAMKDGFKDSQELACEFKVEVRPVADREVVATFDWTAPANHTDKYTEGSTSAIEVQDLITQADKITATISGSGTTTARFHYQNGWALRLYQKGTDSAKEGHVMTLSLPENHNGHILKVEFEYANSKTLSLEDGQPGYFDGKTWTPENPEGVEAQSVISRASVEPRQLVFHSKNGNVQIKSTTVTHTDVPTGIEQVEAVVDAAPVYYNLQGVRVAHPAEGGIYIRVRGTQVDKIRL